MIEQYGLERQDAVALASVAVDLRVARRLVNAGVLGVHALLREGALRRATS